MSLVVALASDSVIISSWIPLVDSYVVDQNSCDGGVVIVGLGNTIIPWIFPSITSSSSNVSLCTSSIAKAVAGVVYILWYFGASTTSIALSAAL